jgi:hypothetical protein
LRSRMRGKLMMPRSIGLLRGNLHKHGENRLDPECRLLDA